MHPMATSVATRPDNEPLLATMAFSASSISKTEQITQLGTRAAVACHPLRCRQTYCGAEILICFPFAIEPAFAGGLGTTHCHHITFHGKTLLTLADWVLTNLIATTTKIYTRGRSNMIHITYLRRNLHAHLPNDFNKPLLLYK